MSDANRIGQFLKIGATAAGALALLRFTRLIDRSRSWLDQNVQTATRLVEEKARAPALQDPTEKLVISAQARLASHLPLDTFIDLIATLIVQHQWERAVSVSRAGAKRGWAAKETFQDVATVLASFMSTRARSLDALERTIERLSSSEYQHLRGALRLLLGRGYRDDLHRPTVAQSLFRQANTELDPRDPAAVIELGSTWYITGAYHHAASCFNEAETNGRQTRPGGLLGRAIIAEDAGQWSTADECYRQAAVTFSNERDPLTLLERALTVPRGRAYLAIVHQLRVLGNHAAALQACDSALRYGLQGPDPYPEAEAYQLHAELLTETGATSDAATAYYEAGRRFSWRGNAARAVTMLQLARRRDAMFHPAVWQLADALRMRAQAAEPGDRKHVHDLTEARRLLESLDAEPLDSVPSWVMVSRALVLEALADAAKARHNDPLRWEAAVYGERALSLAPESGFTHAVLARLHRELGHRGLAFELSARAHELSPVDILTLEERLIALANQERFDEAPSLLKHLPDDAWRRSVEGYIRLSKFRQLGRQDDLTQAQALLASAHTERDSAWIKLALATCHALLGELARARELWQAARSRATSSGDAADRAAAELFLEMFDDAARTARDLEPSPFSLLILGAAELASDRTEAARDAFARLAPLVSGGLARVCAHVLMNELRCLGPFGEAESENRRQIRTWIVRTLEKRALRDELPSAAVDVERLISQRTNSEQSARNTLLQLVRARLALAAGELETASEQYRNLKVLDARASLDGLAWIDAARAALGRRLLRRENGGDELAAHNHEIVQLTLKGCLDANEQLNQARWKVRHAAALATYASVSAIPTNIRFVADVDLYDWLVSPRQVWVLLEAWRDSRDLCGYQTLLESWLEQHLGLAATAHTAGPNSVLLEVPPGLFTGEGDRQALREVMQAARSTVRAQFGVNVPPLSVSDNPNLSDTCVLRAGDAPIAQMSTSHPDATIAAIGHWLTNAIRSRLDELVGTSVVIELVESWAQADPHRSLVRDNTDMKRLIRLVRMLLREQVPVRNRSELLRAFESVRDFSLEDQLEHTRMALRSDLPGNEINGGVSYVRNAIPERLEELVRKHLRPDHVQMLPLAAEVELVTELEGLMPLEEATILIVRDPQLRLPFQRLAERIRRGVLVLSVDEGAGSVLITAASTHAVHVAPAPSADRDQPQKSLELA